MDAPDLTGLSSTEALGNPEALGVTETPGGVELQRARRVTLADVAQHANVSRATASLVVRNAGKLSADTRDRVRAAMLELGYVYHRGAAALRAQRSQSIGLIVPDVSMDFTAEVTMGLESALVNSGIVTLVANSSESLEHQDLLVQSMLERQVDGLLVIPTVGSGKAFAETLLATGIPTVIATREIGDDRLPYVGIDNLRAGHLVAAHLLEHECRKVAYLGGFEQLSPRVNRVQGVREELASSGRAELVVDMPGPARGSFGYEITRGLLEQGALPEGIVCHNDLVAFGVYRALREFAPERLRSVHVIAHDDVSAAVLWDPPLTTLAARGRLVGQECAQLLLRRIKDPGGTPEHKLIASDLVVRQSCGCPVPASA